MKLARPNRTLSSLKKKKKTNPVKLIVIYQQSTIELGHAVPTLHTCIHPIGPADNRQVSIPPPSVVKNVFTTTSTPRASCDQLDRRLITPAILLYISASNHVSIRLANRRRPGRSRARHAAAGSVQETARSASVCRLYCPMHAWDRIGLLASIPSKSKSKVCPKLKQVTSNN